MSWRLRSPKTLAHRWPLNGHTNDLIRGQHGTLVNTPTWATNQFGKQCIELDGLTQYVNLGDVTALNAVSAFTLAFWMNQDVLDMTDHIFYKGIDANNRIDFYTHAGGSMYFLMQDATIWGRIVDYSLVISARHWAHIAVVHDGSQADNANRFIVYVDGVPITLGFSGTIPATIVDLADADATIGQAVTSFDGKLSDFRLFSVALTQDEVNTIIHEPKPVY